MWRSVFKQLFFNLDDHTSTLEDALPPSPNSENVKETFQLINDPSIVIIDELDRLGDPEIERMLADTVKTLSDNSINTTLILVGVADSVDQLIGEHHSIERAIIQIPMPPMSKPELLEIVDKGLSKCEGLSIDPEVRERLADYSQGLPTYTHLLAREAATEAVRLGRTNITMDDLHAAIKEAVDSQLETNLTAYNIAVTAPRGKNFKPVLLACALAEKDDKGYFYANAVKQPLQAITQKPYDIPAFARHLKDFSDASRGPILEKDGRRYRFLKPLMVPYVVLRGLADGLISENQLNRPSATSSEREQLTLRLSMKI
jgi:Cdc6-like AAA superfamily ATPase